MLENTEQDICFSSITGTLVNSERAEQGQNEVAPEELLNKGK